jgi:hypothetical protein
MRAVLAGCLIFGRPKAKSPLNELSGLLHHN